MLLVHFRTETYNFEIYTVNVLKLRSLFYVFNILFAYSKINADFTIHVEIKFRRDAFHMTEVFLF